MSRSRSKKSKGAQTPLFIQKLIDMLQDSSIAHIISWTSTNDSFHIKSISQFTQTILPRFFKHNNFSSFIRQLNMYGFRKIRHQDGQNVYENQNFKRGNRNLLKNIKRKVNLEREDRLALYAQQSHSKNTLSRQINQMKNKQKDLQQICRHLLLQNHKLIEENNNLMKRMKDEQKKKQQKIQQLLIAMIAASQSKQPAITGGQHNQHYGSSEGNVGNMLSIMTGQNETDLNVLNTKADETPLEVITNALSRNKSMKQFKQMLQNYYNSNGQNSTNGEMRMTRNRNSRNFHTEFANDNVDITKKSPNKNTDPALHEEESNGLHFDSHQPNNQNFSHHVSEPDFVPQQDEDGFISINDFMNLDEEKPIIDEEQPINLEQSN